MLPLASTARRVRTMTERWTEADTARAMQIWEEYQRQHDVSARKGQAVGIDPVSGRVWFGESAKDIWRQLRQEGGMTLLLYLRVGHASYLRRG
jgi:hypothetical protein